jgi:hypothetical protein
MNEFLSFKLLSSTRVHVYVVAYKFCHPQNQILAPPLGVLDLNHYKKRAYLRGKNALGKSQILS